ncbi:MAG: peptidoglycan recognition family protein [Planctomycetota bacterium]
MAALRFAPGLACAGFALFAACTAGGGHGGSSRAAASAAPSAAAGEAIVVCGARISIGTPVVLWSDPGGYDASTPGPVFTEDGPPGLRYQPGRDWSPRGSALTLDELRTGVDLLVLHYDACGFSRRCFRLLQDERVLSAHFLLDADGTLYQTLDLRDQAWHGRATNARSIGIEMAQMGVYTRDDDPWDKQQWYQREGGQLRLTVPEAFGDPHFRRPGPLYSARNEVVRGSIHGRTWEQVDFTPQQYDALVKLTAALRRIFPKIALDAPRAADGTIRAGEVSKREIDKFQGVLGHYHITSERNDPGPAFDWDRLFDGVRAADEQRWPR